ncbi:hypothetical protein OA84_06685 [Kaistella solincola]|uniref:Uncharacterized protein n=1 Tax=Kaistella solincola TaxID=510955 RepID=A0ABR4ZPZ7_9FLAO|nr:hypothetical protein [Kaistella solincola]KIA83230.1 hypothetical protein OA84_06685 [Kaistella solincola]
MNITEFIFLIISAAILNVAVFFLFKKYIFRMENPAMKFLGLNIIKDLIWVVFWLSRLENTTESFLAVIGVFLVMSIFLYFKVIQMLNRS